MILLHPLRLRASVRDLDSELECLRVLESKKVALCAPGNVIEWDESLPVAQEELVAWVISFWTANDKC